MVKSASRKEETARGPVSRVLSTCRSMMGDHSSRRTIAGPLKQPTRATGRRIPICRPYSVLLPVGFTMPPLLPEARCALTAPFRPNRAEATAVCFLWHCPWGHPRRALPGTDPRWSPDFPPAGRSLPAAARPSGRASFRPGVGIAQSPMRSG